MVAAIDATDTQPMPWWRRLPLFISSMSARLASEAGAPGHAPGFAVEVTSSVDVGPTRWREHEIAPKAAKDCPRRRPHACGPARSASVRNSSEWRRRFRASRPRDRGHHFNRKPESMASGWSG
jgi:hypothetical protein